MNSIDSILVATDFSVDGNNAVRRAALLAQQHQAGLHILHVLKDSGCRPIREWFSPLPDTDVKASLARAALHRVAVQIAAAYDVTATVEVKAGDVMQGLSTSAQGMDLVVLGRRGHGLIDKLRVGRTTDRLLRTCRSSVLVVRSAAEAPYRRALLPVDFTTGSEAALGLGAMVATGARMHLFHAADSVLESMLRRADVSRSTLLDVRAREETGLIARMRRSIARLGLDSRRVGFSIGRGPADLAALRLARLMGSDLIVMGRSGQSTLGRFLLGSVSRSVLSDAPCDVLVVPGPREASPARQVDEAKDPGGTAQHWMHDAANSPSRQSC